MNPSIILKIFFFLLCGFLVSSGADSSPKKRPFRTIGIAEIDRNTIDLDQSRADRPALPTPDQAGRVHDTQKAIRLAQSYFKRGLWESAVKWYATALDYDPKNKIAAEGFVLSSFHLGQYHSAFAFGENAKSTSPHVLSTVAIAAKEELDLLLAQGELKKAAALLAHFPEDWSPLDENRRQLRHLEVRKTGWKIARKSAFQSALDAASAAYRDGLYHQSLSQLELASRERSLPREAQLMKGRCLIHLNQLDDAALLFEKLYQTQTDIESARGIVLSLHRKGDHDRLERLVSEWGGILAHETEDYRHKIVPDIKPRDAI